MIGQTLGRYRILDKLGAGGMGEVFLALDTDLDRRIALKVLPAAMARSPERLKRFKREAKTLASLNHPNIVTIYSVESIENVNFLTMEHLEGRTLSDYIPRGGVSLQDFFAIAIPLTDALAAAHDQGVIHRDLKPGNVIVTRKGIVKVLDFGLAKHRQTTGKDFDSDGPTESLTGEGRVLGTVPYMSPEQLMGQPLDHRTDIFSLGIVLYQMATGERPFKGNTSAEIHSSILRDVPEPVDHLNAELPHHVARMVGLCLEKSPDSRLQSARDVRNELSVLQQEVTSGESGARSGDSRPLRRTSGLGWFLLGVVLILMGIYATWQLTSRGLDPDPVSIAAEAQVLLDQAELLELRATKESLEQAEDRLRRALLLEPHHPAAQARLASLLNTLQVQQPHPDRPEEIRRLAAAAIETDPDNLDAWVALGKDAISRGELEVAMDAANRAIKIAPENHAGFTLRGRTLIAQDRVDEGLADLHQAVTLAGTDVKARLVLASNLWSLGRNNEAAGEYEKVLRYNPDSPTALNNLGAIYGQQGRLLDAIPLFRHLLELSEDADAAHNLANCYFFSNRLDEAVAAYRRVLEIDPDHPYAPHGLAESYEKLGESQQAQLFYEESLESYDRLMEAGSRDAETLGLRAVCAAKLGRYREAIQDIEEAEQNSPDYGEVLYYAAQVYSIAGDRDQAFTRVRRAIEAGYPRQEFERNVAFADYRNDPEFRTLLETAASP